MNRVCSIFSQLLQLFPRVEFEALVRELEAERHARGFTCWDQFVAMLFCQLGRAQSLREICGGLAATEGKLKHLGVRRAPVRSTLAYANEHRPWQLYQKVFEQLLARCQALCGKKRKFRFKNKLVSMDATSIDLCASLFDWARYKQTKGAAKIHLLLDHDGYLPVFACITDGNTHEIEVARQWAFARGTVVVMDRGYVDYDWWRRLTEQKVYFVTRFKSDVQYEVIKELEIPAGSPICRDEVIRLRSSQHRDYLTPFRRIEVWVEEKQETMTFFTNHLRWAAGTIAAIYKERWQIEIFFKSLKQTLRVKTFVGTSSNALRTQIWTALIAMLLLKYLQMRSTFHWSLSNLCALLRQQLFVYRPLFPWLDQPFHPPPQLEGLHDQLPLPLEVA